MAITIIDEKLEDEIYEVSKRVRINNTQINMLQFMKYLLRQGLDQIYMEERIHQVQHSDSLIKV